MKVLYLSQGFNLDDHPGWNDALQKLKDCKEISEFLNIPYLGFAEKFGWSSFYDKIIELCRHDKFDVVFFQYFHRKSTPSPRKFIKEVAKLENRPLILISAGDGFSDKRWMRPDYPRDFKELSQFADITFSTQMGRAAERMIAWGAKRVVLSPNGLCQKRFPSSTTGKPDKLKYDVIFIGSKNESRNPLSVHFWAGRKRNRIVKALNDRYGDRLGLFGKGWTYKTSHGMVSFEEQLTLYKSTRVIVGGNPYSMSDYYSSNRLFVEVASGVPTVEFEVPRLRNIFNEANHIFYVDGIEKLLTQIDNLLEADPYKINENADLKQNYVYNNHTQFHRLKFQLDAAKHLIENGNLVKLDLPYFPPNVDLESERLHAIVCAEGL